MNMNKFFRILLVALLASVSVVSCDPPLEDPIENTGNNGGGDSPSRPSQPSQPTSSISEEIQQADQFAINALGVYYLWSNEINKDLSKLSPETCSDPMSEIGLYTDPPMLIQTPIPTVVPYSIPYMVPQVGSPERSLAPPTAVPTTAPTAEPTIVPTALGYSRTLPEYLLYPPDRGYHRDEINKLSHYLIYPPEATSMPPVEIYRLEAEDIKRLRARLEGGGYSDNDFLEELGELANE